MITALTLAWTLGPPVTALTIAALARFVALRSVPALGPRLTAATATTGTALFLAQVGIAVLGVAGALALSSPEAERVRAIAPLVMGTLGVMGLSIPAERRPRARAATVARRTVSVFLSRGWPLAITGIGALVLILSLAAGSVSRPDAEGRSVEFALPIGPGGEARTTIYGWYFSVPALIVTGLLLVVTAIAWHALTRFPWGEDIALDTAVRRTRAANIGRATTGALLIHLSFITRSLAGTASISGRFESGPWIVPSFAAMGPALSVASLIALIGGLALWAVVAFTAIPGRGLRTRDPAE
ncbi:MULTISPECIES: hypothetical protein [unclassified Microbacterium]|uniref:hypothetical protein n=1 Tax=unclassified Microbacterium TaxID=2609290 RepID=UPI00301038C8